MTIEHLLLDCINSSMGGGIPGVETPIKYNDKPLMTKDEVDNKNDKEKTLEEDVIFLKKKKPINLNSQLPHNKVEEIRKLNKKYYENIKSIAKSKVEDLARNSKHLCAHMSTDQDKKRCGVQLLKKLINDLLLVSDKCQKAGHHEQRCYKMVETMIKITMDAISKIEQKEKTL